MNSSLSHSLSKMLRSAVLSHGKQIHLIEENLQRSDQ